MADGEGLASHACAGLLAEAGERLGLTAALSRGLAGMRVRRGRHDRGRVVRELAAMLADGGDCLVDLRAVRGQEPLFGAVASDATALRVIAAIAADPALDAVRAARGIDVVELALEQLPREVVEQTPIVVRTDSAAATHEPTDELRAAGSAS